MSRRSRSAISAAAGAVAALVLVVGATVLARGSGPDSGARVIPYQGRLERNGTALSSANLPMTFTLYAPGQSWSFGPTPVDVYSGSFSVLIGDLALPGLPGGQTGVPDWVFTQTEVEVGVEVDGVPLSGRQRIAPVPYAYWAAESDSFTVANSVHLGNVGNRQGAQVYWNRSGGQGETNLVNHHGLGSGGGFTFDDTADGASFSRLMTVAASGDVSTGRDLHVGSDLAVGNGEIYFGTRLAQQLNLWNAEYGMGIQASTLYQRSGSNFAWYKGGTHNDTTWNPGGGEVQMNLDTNGNLAARGAVYSKGVIMATGKHCVVKQRDFACPEGFTESYVRWDTEDSDNNDYWGGDWPRLGFVGGLTMWFCCN